MVAITLKQLQKLPLVQALLGASPTSDLYLVGGSARDSIRNKGFKDVDLLVTGLPAHKLLTLLSPYGDIDTSGEKFGVYKILLNHDGPLPFEIALPRKETYTLKGGRFDVHVEVNPAFSVEDDMKRRDFTMNAIAINCKTQDCIDVYEGKKDIQEKIIRSIGDPLQKLKEDHSRVLRALRLSVQLGYSLENSLARACKDLISTETLHNTLDKKTIHKEFELSWRMSPGKTTYLWNSVGLTDLVTSLIHSLPPISLQPTVLFENEHYLVINKPAGVLSHPLTHESSHDDPSVVHWLLQRDPSHIHIGEDVERPGIVHRLDKEVSGVMVIAKTQDAYMSLKDAFQRHDVHKEYKAVVIGTIQKDEGVIDLGIARSKKTGHFIVSTDKEESRKAHTAFEVMKRLRGGYTLLTLMPSTGRTHQLRVHLKSYGAPIVGDPLYQTKKRHSRAEVDHLLLHAYSIDFPTLNGERKSISVPPPDYFLSFISRYESN